MVHHISKKAAKKKALQQKNRYHQMIYEALRIRRAEDERGKSLEKSRKPARTTEGRKGDKDKEVWSEKVATIRNRLDGSKRTSKERWNRFAGTEGGGGRGL